MNFLLFRSQVCKNRKSLQSHLRHHRERPHRCMHCGKGRFGKVGEGVVLVGEGEDYFFIDINASMEIHVVKMTNRTAVCTVARVG